MQDADLVVEPLDHAQAELVIRVAVGGNAGPVAIDHVGELLVGFEPLPLEGVAPAIEETPRASLGLVVPELPEKFLQQVGHVESLVGLEKLVQSPLSLQREVLAVREKRVALTLDEGPIPTRKAVVLASPHLVESIGEMSHDMELVVDDLHIRDVPLGRVVEGLPHVHRRQFDVAGLGLANPLEEEIEVCLPAAVATHPDRAAAIQVADHDAVVVPLADGGFRRRR